MSLLRVKVIWYGSGGTDTGVELTQWTKLSVKKEIKSSNNGLDLQIPIHFAEDDDLIDSEGELKIKLQDVIKVYAKYVDDNSDVDTSPTSTDLLITADVVAYKSTYDGKKRVWTLQCDDKTHLVLSRIWAKSYRMDENKTAPEIIKELVQRASNLGNATAAIDADFVSEGGFIQDTRPDGSNFPVISVAKVWKPFYEWIDDLSQVQNLNDQTEIDDQTAPADKSYVFYVDELNRFHWFYPNSLDVDFTQDGSLIWYKNSSEINAREISHKLEKSTFDNINMIIFKCGQDLNGVGILDYYYDVGTENKNLKMVFKPFTDVAERNKRTMVNQETPSLVFDEDLKDYDYVAGTAYPVTPFWTSTTYSNDNDLNDAFRNYCKQLGDVRAQKIVSRFGSPRWKGQITFQGYPFNGGELLTYSNTEVGIDSVNVRIKKVTHQIDKTSWTSTVDVEEDEESILAN